MKLEFEDLIGRNMNVVSEDQIQEFMNKSLDSALEITTDVLKRKPSLEDIEEFTLSGLWGFLDEIKEYRNVLFTGEGESENVLWHVIIDKDIVLFDSYFIDRENENLINYFNYEIKITGKNKGEASIKLSDELKEIDKDIDVDILMVTTPMRLAYYLILFTKINIQ